VRFSDGTADILIRNGVVAVKLKAVCCKSVSDGKFPYIVIVNDDQNDGQQISIQIVLRIRILMPYRRGERLSFR